MDLFSLIAISIVVGVFVGTLSGLLGIGGGTILVTAFKLIFGLPALASTATSMFTIIPTSISGSLTHIRNKTCVPKFGVAAGIGGAITSPLGVWLATQSPEWMVMVAAALIIGYSAITMVTKALKLWKTQKAQKENAGVKETSEIGNDKAEDMLENGPAGAKPILVSASIGLLAGLLSGYVGVGGGFLMVPLMISVLHLPMKKVSGTSLIGVMILAIPGTVTQALLGNVNWIAGLFVSMGAIPGAYLGSKLLPKVPEIALRFGFGIFLLFSAGLLALDQLI